MPPIFIYCYTCNIENQSTNEKNTAVFMCRLCNLFSPSHSQLLAHCCQVHPQHEPPDDIIIALQPLIADPVEGLADGSVKRKRGRPKGSTKKMHTDLTAGKAISTSSQDDNFETGEMSNKRVGDQQCSSAEAKSCDVISGLECKDCHRTFSNRRQILKHICLRADDEEEDEQKGSISGEAEGENSENLDPGGADPKSMKQNPKTSGHKKEKRSRTNRTREVGLPTANKKAVVSVVLTEDETFPGVSRMVPVEDSSAETESAARESQPQESAAFESDSQDLHSETTASEHNPETDQHSSSTLPPTTTTAAANKGFQEYSIKQDDTNLLQSQLKIFACEFCNKIFKFRHSLVAHLRTHTQEKPFQCPHCDYASAIKANLNVHLRKHTGEKFSCEHCPFNCFSPGHLKVHIERVHMKVKQHCSFCEQKYSDVKNLLKHMEKRHSLKDPAVYQTYQELRLKTRQGLRQLLYHCPTCNRRFKNHLQRERHLLVHGPHRPFACQLCDHAATKLAALAAHVRKHIFLYVCRVCEEKFVSSQKLKSHLKESHPELDQEQAFTECINNSYYQTQPGGGLWGTEGSEDIPRGNEEEHRIGEENEDDRMREEGEGSSEGCSGRQDAEREHEDAQSQEEGVEAVQVIERPTEEEGEVENTGVQDASQDRQDEATAGEKSPDKTADFAARKHEKDKHTSSSLESAYSPLSEDRTKENNHRAAENTRAVKHTQQPAHSLSGNTSDPSAHTDPLVDEQTSFSENAPEISHQSAFEQVFSSLQKTPLNIETFQQLRKIYGDLECQYCGKLFWYKVHYNVHVRTHTKEHSHYCTKCSYSSITKSSLNRHQIQKHSGLLLSCSNPGCTYSTPDKYKLQAHLRTHQKQGKSVACPVCHCSYSEHRLKWHIKTSHPDSVPLPGKGRLMVQRAEKCPYCDSYFLKNSSDFQQHIWAHQGLKPYVCSMCDYAGRSRSNLKTHMNRHNTERRHLCDLCGKKFKSKFTLKSHRLSHTGEGKRFQCSECDFTSVSKPALIRHMEQHAKFKPFRCAHCHYSCNIAGALKRHYNVKHPDHKYENAGPGLPNPDILKQQGGMKCPECEFVYGTKWELKRHLKSKHSLKVVEGTWEVGEEVEAQYVSVEDEDQLTEAPLAALQDNVNIQQITEFSSETQEAVTSMVAMAPGTVTVVQQVTDEQEVGDQLMVVDAEGGLNADQVMVVEEAHGLEALTVLTQGENTHHYIVYVQEHTVEIN
ncbi:zinc finger protein ZFAT isoform X3 [Parambassis ranga]|uniref:Zinc finger protein ZFAT isoform X3 n=1 Tax=Parambassis ranga TaxID=210632 RepID=A0A6P7JUH7_9TELE|nr:zinc finger protein ZFAT isoform X3 [Parambassis ranga]